MINVLWIPLPILVVAAVVDWKTHRIWDGYSWALLVCAVLFAATGWTTVGWLGSLVGALAGLLLGALLHRFLELGAGDVGLLGGIGAIVGVAPLLLCLFYAALLGGAHAGVAWRRGQREIPYAPAIAGGYLGLLITLAIRLAATG